MRLHNLRIVGLALVIVLVLAGCTSLAETIPPNQALAAPIKANVGVVAEGRVLPRANVRLASGIGGEVVQLLVAEGDQVTPGQVLLQLDDVQFHAAVAEAESNLRVTQARLAQDQAGATAEQVAVAAAAAAVAASGVQSAEGAVASAQANLARIRSGATADELAIAQRRVEGAKNALFGAQAQRDSICGQPGPKSSCDAAQAAVQQAEEGVNISELQLQQLKDGASKQEIAVAAAQVQQALGQLEGAKSGLAQAEASLAEVKKGTPREAIAVAEAQVTQAQTAVDRARASLADTQVAPIAGQVVSLEAKLGERVNPGVPIVQLADLSAFEVETQDLTEIEVVHVAIGQKVAIVADALPDTTITGTVETIKNVFEEKRGDVTYAVRIRLEDAAALPLRWGMTVKVSFEQPK